MVVSFGCYFEGFVAQYWPTFLWDYWPTFTFPDGRPPFPAELINTIARFATLHGGLLIQLPEPTCIPKLQWSYNNWSQLEICTRHLALLTDAFCEAYTSECRHVTESIFDRRIKFVKHIKTLLDHILQMHWWLHALF
jgi:hypothetical protein